MDKKNWSVENPVDHTFSCGLTFSRMQQYLMQSSLHTEKNDPHPCIKKKNSWRVHKTECSFSDVKEILVMQNEAQKKSA